MGCIASFAPTGRSARNKNEVIKIVTRKEADLRFYRDDAWVIFGNKKDCPNWKTKDFPHYEIWKHAIKLLENKGYRIFIDHNFAEEYRSLVSSHRWGIRRRLRFQSEIYPAGFKIGFYQNIRTKNPNGGFYEFHKYKLMPKKYKIMFNSICKYLIKELCKKYNLKFYDQSDIRFPALTAEQRIIKHISECSFNRGEMKSLSETAEYMSEYDFKHNSKSGCGDELKCGELRRYKDMNDRIRKGRVYHNINNMWWVIRSKYKYDNIASFNILEKVKP